MIGSPSFGVWFCSNKSKSTVESTFDDAKVRRIKNRKPLYRTYNRGYIGDAMPDYQTVISIRKCLVNFYRTRWHAAQECTIGSVPLCTWKLREFLCSGQIKNRTSFAAGTENF